MSGLIAWPSLPKYVHTYFGTSFKTPSFFFCVETEETEEEESAEEEEFVEEEGEEGRIY